MQAQKSNFLGWNNNVLVSSLRKINFDIFPIVFLDALFYFLSGYAVIFWVQRIQEKMASFYMPQNLLALAPEAAKQLASEVKGFYYLIIVSLLLLAAAVIFLASILKGVIWAKTTGTKITFRLISGFFMVNLAWIGFWLVLVFLIAYLAEPAYAQTLTIASIIFGLYFTNALYAIFMKEQRFKSILHAVRLCISKFRLFLLPYLAVYLLLYIMIKLSSLLKLKHSAIFLAIVLLFYAAVARYYISGLAHEVANLK